MLDRLYPNSFGNVLCYTLAYDGTFFQFTTTVRTTVGTMLDGTVYSLRLLSARTFVAFFAPRSMQVWMSFADCAASLLTSRFQWSGSGTGPSLNFSGFCVPYRTARLLHGHCRLCDCARWLEFCLAGKAGGGRIRKLRARARTETQVLWWQNGKETNKCPNAPTSIS